MCQLNSEGKNFYKAIRPALLYEKLNAHLLGGRGMCGEDMHKSSKESRLDEI